MTRVLLIAAAPTPWDVEDRVVGNHSLPLTPEAHQAIAELIGELVPLISVIYCCQTNEACSEAADLIAKKFKLRPKHHEGLQEMNLGLWQGLRRQEIAFRFPSVVELWEKDPLAVEPPEGETIPAAVERIKDALRSILRKNRGMTVALVLRPVALQIVAGLLRRETLDQIVTHLQALTPVDTIEVSEDDIRSLE